MKTVTYNIGYTYCPNDHLLIFVPSSTLYSDCYYCKNCNKIYAPVLEEKTKAYFKEEYVTDRFNEIRNYALFLEGKEKVNRNDLIKLGYLKE